MKESFFRFHAGAASSPDDRMIVNCGKMLLLPPIPGLMRARHPLFRRRSSTSTV